MKKLVVVAATAGLSLTGLGVAGAQAATPADAFKPSAVKWHACPADFVQTVHDNYDALYPVSKIVQCGELSVPLDWSKPKGQKITVALTRTPHTAKGPAKGDIVVNPGGPGGVGSLFGPRVFAQNSPAMRAAYNVIGFDPRGVGMSKPALTCDTSYSQGPRPDYGTGDRKSVTAWLAKSKGYAKACAKKYGKGSKVNMLDHIKTIDVVKDVNALRAALGRQKLDYYGASYGTYIGQVYATVFPKRVGRMVLDGNVGPSGVWYKANLSQDVAFDTNINYYFGWIAKYDSVYHLGKTQKAVRSYFYGLRNKLAKKPVFGVNSDGTKTVVGSDDLTDNIQNAGYRRSQAVWNSYAAGLSAYKGGDVKALLDTFGAPTKASGVPVDDNGYAIYSAVQCTDVQWPLSWKKWQRDNTQINKKHPFLTWGNAWYNAPCLYWGAKAGKPVKIGATKDLPKNILMFQSTNDAATPYGGALELHKTLRGSHLVVQDGDRTHCIVHRGSAAVDAYFDAYFLTGKLPNKSTVHVPQLGDPTPPAAQANTLNAGQSQAAVNDVIR